MVTVVSLSYQPTLKGAEPLATLSLINALASTVGDHPAISTFVDCDAAYVRYHVSRSTLDVRSTVIPNWLNLHPSLEGLTAARRRHIIASTSVNLKFGSFHS
jgi:hypothetical protein